MRNFKRHVILISFVITVILASSCKSDKETENKATDPREAPHAVVPKSEVEPESGRWGQVFS